MSQVYIPVAGTNAGKRDYEWTDHKSSFSCYMKSLGYNAKAEEFGFWSTALAGTFFTGSGHLAWQFGGQQLYKFLNSLPYDERNIIGHSHAGAVIAYMLALKPVIPIRSLITVDSPIPRALDDVWKFGEGTVKTHVHLYGTGWGSRMRWLGQRGRFKREMEWADYNIPIKGGHSGILRKPKYIPQISMILKTIRDNN